MTRWQLWIYFLRLGLTGFGGPLALIAQMQLDLVEKKRLVDPDEFRASLAMIKSLPGPVAIQVVAFLSRRLFGPVTAIVSCFLFVLPAAVMMICLSIYDSALHAHPWISVALVGMQAAAFVLIAAALIPLTKGYEKRWSFWFLVSLSFALIFGLHISEPLVIVVMAVLALLLENRPKATVKSVLVWELFLVCVKAGGLAFGTGLAIVPMLHGDFVDRQHWITNSQFMSALAFGQLTPGPISVTVTYVGYQLAGLPGAIVATIGIFAPGIFNMLSWFPLALTWLRKQDWIGHFVRGAIAAIVGGILNALLSLHEETPTAALIMAAVFWFLIWKKKWPSWLLVLGTGSIWLVSTAMFQ